MISAGTEYKEAKVNILQYTPLAVAEIAGRVCYDSFDKSDNEEMMNYEFGKEIPDIEESALLEKLSHVFFHGSVAEHVTITFHIKGMSRGVLQELARHRIASLSVRSTRYTMVPMLIAGAIAHKFNNPDVFIDYVIESDTLVLTGEEEKYEAINMFGSLINHIEKLTFDEYINLVLNNKQKDMIKEAYDTDGLLEEMIKLGSKRNAGDSFKYLVSDNWSTELVTTVNLRALTNFFVLRDSGSAWFQIRDLAKKMFDVIPEGHQKVIRKTR